jgi:uncharacterized membrane protein
LRDRALRIAVVVVALAGAAVAGYLTYVHYQPEALVCTGGGGCEKVQDSEYATILGVPVAVLGLAAYASVLALTAWDTPTARALTVALTLGALAFALYLIAVQAFAIEAWCFWCLVNDLLVVPLLALLGLLRLRAGEESLAPTSSAPGGEPSA